MNISYLVTCHNEDKTLDNLLSQLVNYLEGNDEIIVLDDFSDNPKTKEIFKKYSNRTNVKVYQHSLDKNYGAHKNYGTTLCKNEWVFQLDSDELPTEMLLTNLKYIIESNPDIEVFVIPRVNDFKGVTPIHAKQWGWTLTKCKECDNRPIVNYPDYQGRIYKNEPSRIRWDRKLHEKLEGYTKFSHLPMDINLAMYIYHDKTIETQLQTNKRYNEWFTEEENRGHRGYK